MTRDERQAAITEWTRSTFGEATLCKEERVMRLLEEVVELAQAEGVPFEVVRRIAGHVYAKPPGRAEQEVGGITITLAAYCGVTGLSAEECEKKEFARVLAISRSHFQERHNRKADAGIAVRAV